MSDPDRLLDGELPDDIASLLRSADGDVPPAAEDKQRRICAAIVSANALAPTANVPAPSNRLRNAGWAGLAVMVIGASVLAVETLSFRAHSPPAAASTVDVSPLASSAGLALLKEEPIAIPSMRVDELPSSAPPAARGSSAALAPHAPTREAASLEDELRVVDAARGALAANHPEATLAHLQRYRRAFPAPRFVDEADALEVQALAALGRTNEARAKADAFVAAHPRSPYTQRVRSAASATNGGGDHADPAPR